MRVAECGGTVEMCASAAVLGPFDVRIREKKRKQRPKSKSCLFCIVQNDSVLSDVFLQQKRDDDS